MIERIEIAKAFTGAIKNQFSGEFDSRVRFLNLFEHQKARRLIDLSLRGIEVDPMPPFLEEGQSAILTSNYPSVVRTTEAVLKVGCRLPGQEARIKVIAREEIITRADFFLKALGVDELVFPAQKDEAGIYRLKGKEFIRVLKFLEESGHVIWLSVTGKTEGNGLLEKDLRTGVYLFSLRSQVPVVPMGVETEEKKGKRKVVAVRFGEPINPPDIRNLNELEESDYPFDYSRLVMCQIARLLPSGQRGSFEDAEEKLEEVQRRLEAYSA